jgi:hypothetical protein
MVEEQPEDTQIVDEVEDRPLESLSDDDFPDPEPPAADPPSGESESEDPSDISPDADPAVDDTPAFEFHDQVAAMGIQGVNAENAGQMLLEQYQYNLQNQQQQNAQMASTYDQANQYNQLRADPEYQKWVESRNQPQNTEPEAPAHESWFNAPPKPDYKKLGQYAELDDQGNTVWKVDPVTNQYLAPQDFRDQAINYANYRDTWAQRWNEAPHEVMQEVIKNQVVPEIQAQMQTQQANISQRYEAEQILQENSSWLFGVNPATGYEELTPAGQAYREITTSLRSRDVPVREAHGLALAQVQQQFAQQQQPQAAPPQAAPPQTPADLAEAKKKQHLAAGGNYIANRDGTVPQNGTVNPAHPDVLAEPTLDITQFLDSQVDGDDFVNRMMSSQ